jgi:hypothetical protein
MLSVHEYWLLGKEMPDQYTTRLIYISSSQIAANVRYLLLLCSCLWHLCKKSTFSLKFIFKKRMDFNTLALNIRYTTCHTM